MEPPPSYSHSKFLITMARYYCPYCGTDNLDWRRGVDDVAWMDYDTGVIVTTNVRCANPSCKGSHGFTVKIPFMAGDDIGYYDYDGALIVEGR